MVDFVKTAREMEVGMHGEKRLEFHTYNKQDRLVKITVDIEKISEVVVDELPKIVEVKHEEKNQFLKMLKNIFKI